MAASPTHSSTATGLPDSPIQSYLKRLHGMFARLDDGHVATYIPELGKANPNWFGIAIATLDGQIYEVGDTREPFTIQSISKPLVYGLALETCGLKKVLTRVGVEPSGEAFNSISLDPATGRPLNPMINAGAIATASLIPGATREERLAFLLDAFGGFAGRPLELDAAVYRSESTTGHRNRAIAHLLRNFGILEGDPEQPLDLYFQQCSIAVTCRDLALMAATLANGGLNPSTQQRILQPHNVGRMLTLMSSCGMYDYAGEWMYRVGMPAKSGVAGAILAVLPGQLGVAVFSPRLDPKGNSVRGIRVCTELSNDFSLHLFAAPRPAHTAVRGHFTAATLQSKRLRTATERDILRSRGTTVHLFELRGRLVFATMEQAIRQVLTATTDATQVILDLERVVDLDHAASRLLIELHDLLVDLGKKVALTGISDKIGLRAYISSHYDQGAWETWCRQGTRDDALERAENFLLNQAGIRVPPSEHMPFAAQELCQGLSAAEQGELEQRLTSATFAAGEDILAAGTPADCVCFIASGEVGVFLPANDAPERLILRLGPGMSVGELALVDRQQRSATVRALSTVEIWSLSFDTFDRLPAEGHTALHAKLVANLARVLAVRLRASVAEVNALK